VTRALIAAAMAAWLLAVPAAAQPLVRRPTAPAGSVIAIDFDLLKQAQEQSAADQAAAEAKKAADAKAAADAAAAPPTPPPSPEAAQDSVVPPPVSAPAPRPAAISTSLHVALKLRSGAPAGSVELWQTAHSVHAKVALTGIAPGFHPLHFYRIGSCAQAFATTERPLDDGLAEISAGADGTVIAELVAAHISLAEGPNSLLSGPGAALVVGTPAERIACGAVRP
jgi:Cu/Zn superoxide dismutase